MQAPPGRKGELRLDSIWQGQPASGLQGFFLGLGFRGSRRVLRKIPIRADCKDYIGGSLRASQGLFKDSLAVLRRGLGLGTAA